jgi:hypothetical protein
VRLSTIVLEEVRLLGTRANQRVIVREEGLAIASCGLAKQPLRNIEYASPVREKSRRSVSPIYNRAAEVI